MKPTDFLPHPNPPPLDNPTAAANGDQQPTPEPELRKSWVSEAFDWALAIGGFVLLNNYLFGRKKHD